MSQDLTKYESVVKSTDDSPFFLGQACAICGAYNTENHKGVCKEYDPINGDTLGYHATIERIAIIWRDLRITERQAFNMLAHDQMKQWLRDALERLVQLKK